MKNGSAADMKAFANRKAYAATASDKTDKPRAAAATPDERNSRSLTPLMKLRPYVMRYKGMVLIALVALLLSAGATLALPIAVRRMIDFGFAGEHPEMVHSYFAMLMIVAAVLAVASAARFYCVTWLGERTVSDIRAAVFAHLTRLSPSFYEKTHSAELMSRLTADTTQIKNAVGTSVSQALRNMVMLTGALIMMVATSPKLSALVILAIPLIVLPLVGYGRVVRRLSRRAQDELANASAYAAENLASPRTMQTFTYEPMVIGRYSQAIEDTFGVALLRTRARAALTATAIFLVFASIIGVLWYGANDVLTGAMTGGTLAQFVLYAAFAAGAVAELSEVWGEVQQAAGAAERLGEIMAVEPDISTPANPRPFPAHAKKGQVRFNGVAFHYQARPEAPVLRDLSFTVEPGERVAIVGPSGAGKSTIFNLIMRFYDVGSGAVEIDGVPVDQADLEQLRRRIAYVPQEPAIFAGSIADNIRYGSPDASDEEVRRAAATALASSFIEELPEKYDTQLGERGVMLSGGQRQRLAIARALLRDAPILLLDEATSALDAESESLVKTALERAMDGRTTLVIAHRLATVLSADRILVLNNGEIVEHGRHAELIATGGVYSRLAELQFNAEAAAGAA